MAGYRGTHQNQQFTVHRLENVEEQGQIFVAMRQRKGLRAEFI
jgi:DNA-binding cell septation regulator SpoVG